MLSGLLVYLGSEQSLPALGICRPALTASMVPAALAVSMLFNSHLWIGLRMLVAPRTEHRCQGGSKAAFNMELAPAGAMLHWEPEG